MFLMQKHPRSVFKNRLFLNTEHFVLEQHFKILANIIAFRR